MSSTANHDYTPVQTSDDHEMKPGVDIENRPSFDNIMASLSSSTYAITVFNTLKYPIIIYGVFAAIYSAYLPGKLIWFSYHPFFMILSFIAIVSNALLIKKIGGYDNTKLHGYMMTSALFMALFALYVIYSNKILLGKPHFTSIHGKLGVTVIIGYLALGLVGAIALHPDWGVLRTNKTVRAVHKWLGRLFTSAAWFSCVLGFISKETALWKQIIFAVPMMIFGFFTLI